jgi:hypothetical protein
MSISISTDMPFHFPLCFHSLFLCLPVYLVEDDRELVHGPCWLSAELGWGPAEFFAEAEIRDGGVGLLSSDGADKKAVSSRVKAHKRLTTLESSSPNVIGMPFSSPRSFSSVIGSFGGCCLSAAQIVSACMAMKSLFCTCPDVGW